MAIDVRDYKGRHEAYWRDRMTEIRNDARSVSPSDRQSFIRGRAQLYRIPKSRYKPIYQTIGRGVVHGYTAEDLHKKKGPSYPA